MSSGNSKRERALLALVDEPAEPLFALDSEGRIVECNAAARRLLQRTRTDLRGKPFASCVAPAERRAFREALLRVSGREVPAADLRLRLVNGNAEIATAGIRIRSVPGAPPLLLARVSNAATSQPLPLGAHPEPFEIERYLLELPVAIVGVDRERRVLFANARARRLFAASQLRRGGPLPALGASFSFEHHLDQLLTHGLSIQPELQELPDGRILRVAGAAVGDESMCVLTIDDVTAEFRDARAESAFVRNAAHQLRTPLASMSTAIEVLQAGAKDDPVARDRFLAHLQSGVERLGRLARALLVLARSQAGTQPPRFELVQLEPVLARLAEGLRPTAGVGVAIDCDAEVSALADRDLLEEALAALLDNAVRHTRDGTINLRAARREDGTVEVEVEDSGEGILPEHLEHVFEPFYRPISDGYGFGLGLAIASQAIAAMGAKLEVQSAPLHGTRFWFRLPSAQVFGREEEGTPGPREVLT